MTTTVVVFVPVSTIILEATIDFTSLITVMMTASAAREFSLTSVPTAVGPDPSDLPSIASQTSAVILPLVLTSPIPTSTSLQPSTNPTTSPDGTGQVLSSTLPLYTIMPTSLAAQSGAHPSKTSIIAGLVGAIAGLLMVGLAIFLFLRHRRRHRRKGGAFVEEQGGQYTFGRYWTDLKETHDKLRLPTQQSTEGFNQRASGVTVDEDHHIIRMSTQHWPRPFAYGGDEGYREIVPSGHLRVVNPDPTRPPSSRMSSETLRDFLRRQRANFSDAFYRSPHSRASSQPHSVLAHSQLRHHISQPFAQEVSHSLAVGPQLSQEFIAWPAPVVRARMSSFDKRPSTKALSVSTKSIVRQVPPEDPFLTPSAAGIKPFAYDDVRSITAGKPVTESKLRPTMLQAAVDTTTKHYDAALTALSLLPSGLNLVEKLKPWTSRRIPVDSENNLNVPHSSLTRSPSIISDYSFGPQQRVKALYHHPNSTILLPSPIPYPSLSAPGRSQLKPAADSSDSSWRASRLSDPFDLDRPSVRGSRSSMGEPVNMHSSRRSGAGSSGAFYPTTRKTSTQFQGESWTLYEGT